jgi:hypothetical protein
MSGVDVKSTMHDVGDSSTAVSGNNDKFLAVSGRVRLFNIWVSTGASLKRTATIVMKNGSDSGDILLKYDFNFCRWANPANNIAIPGGGIVFPDGLYFDSGNGGTQYIDSVTFVYQQG